MQLVNEDSMSALHELDCPSDESGDEQGPVAGNESAEKSQDSCVVETGHFNAGE